MTYVLKSFHRIFVINIFVALFALPISASAEQTPWKTTVGNGTSMSNLNWPGYMTGYEFTPLSDGEITQLGGFFNGTKKVYLFNSSNVQLAVASATDNNSWGYVTIDPVAVTQGERYTVAVATGWGGASMYIGQPGFGFGPAFPTFPHVVDDIRIERAVFGFGSSRPTWEIFGQMWGQPDLVFVP